ncbi:MAG: class E sortase [Solirubrobacterales bacterium]|nr:class E sortase [Solirubrobacterales bacterium]
MRRLLRDISWVLIIAGVLLVVDAGVTLIWQEPVTAVVAMIKRSEIDKRFLSYRRTPLTTTDLHALGALHTLDQRVSYLARREQRQVTTGAAIGRIEIGKIGASFDVVQGTDTSSLQKGPGHYPSTAFPGLGQTVAIAGHRTTYLAPFRHIDRLRTGDQIVLRMPYGLFTYVVEYHKIVLPTALWVTRNVGYDRLVLSACNPLYSAAQRIIVFARLAEVQPAPGTLHAALPASRA